jgi:dTDP-4-amino-4,6-dideoxygalactose transaminase
MTALPADPSRSPAVIRRVPLCVPSLPDLDSLLPQLRSIWERGELTNGEYVRQFEARAAALWRGRSVVAVGSCTQGLMLALRVLEVRGEVLLPSFTFAATAHAVVWAGLRPVFVDCDPDTLTMDPVDAARRITQATGAIMGVYVSGNPPDIDALEGLARHAGVPLILDAAHALGSRVGSRPAGCRGDAEVFSLSPTKTVTACEGGLVSVADPAVAEKLRIGRNYGNPGDYDMRFVGLNARMSEVHAVVGLASLGQLDATLAERVRVAAAYRRRLGGLPGLYFQHIRPDNACSYKDLAVRIVGGEFGTDRDAVRMHLTRHGVDTRTYFDPPAHRQTAYRRLGPSPSLPVTERVASEVLDLPIFPTLSNDDIDYVCTLIETTAE